MLFQLALLELLKSLGSHYPTYYSKVALVSLHMDWGDIALWEASTTVNCASHRYLLPSLNGKTPLDGKSTPVKVGQGDQSSLSVNEAPNKTSNNVDRKIRTLYLP